MKKSSKRYKIYSRLLNPPMSGLPILGKKEFLFDKELELIEFIKEEINSIRDIDFLEMIKDYKEYVSLCPEQIEYKFSPKHFYINCFDEEWSRGNFNEGLFTIYKNIEKHSENDNYDWLHLNLEVFDCGKSFFIVIKPIIETSGKVLKESFSNNIIR